MRVLVKTRYLFTMDGPGLGVVEDAGLYVEDGVVVASGPYEDVLKVASKDDMYIDVSRYGLVMPGYVDMHMHTGWALLRGFGHDVPEINWMVDCLSPFSPGFDMEAYKTSHMLAVLEALSTGTVVFGEYGRTLELFIDEVAKPLGIKVAGTYLINAVSQPLYEVGDKLYPLDSEQGYKALDEALRLLRKYRDDENIRIFIGPQALDMVPLEVIHEAFEKAAEYNTYVHMHVAQGGRERRQIKMRYGDSTVNILYREGLLNNRLIAAHMHDASPDELRKAAESGVYHVTCMRSIAGIDGIPPPYIEYTGYGGVSFIGTDQIPGVGNHIMLQELKHLSLISKVYYRDPSIIPPYKIFKSATSEPSKHLKLFKNGVLKPGYQADFIIYNLNKIHTTPHSTNPRNITYILLYSALGTEATHVFIDGQPKTINGKPTNKNIKNIIKKTQKQLQKTLQKTNTQHLKTHCPQTKRTTQNLE